jgi:hypothetical protein
VIPSRRRSAATAGPTLGISCIRATSRFPLDRSENLRVTAAPSPSTLNLSVYSAITLPPFWQFARRRCIHSRFSLLLRFLLLLMHFGAIHSLASRPYALSVPGRSPDSVHNRSASARTGGIQPCSRSHPAGRPDPGVRELAAAPVEGHVFVIRMLVVPAISNYSGISANFVHPSCV